MHKLKMKATKTLTFKEGCEKYLEYCRQINLREGTINHYRQSYTQFYKFFDSDTPIEEFDEDAYKRYVLHQKDSFLCSDYCYFGEYAMFLALLKCKDK